jgi:4a-hydroxytetrahydrobiopterin dehydratase
MEPLPADRLTAALTQLPGWRLADHALHRTYRFASFREALGFMVDAAEEIDRLNHHPEWTNVYDRVTVRLTTHDAGNRVTANDIALAKQLDWCADMRGEQKP